MQVGIVTPRYPPSVVGGGERSVQLLAEQLQISGRVNDVTVLSFDGVKKEIRNGVTVHRLEAISSTVTEWQNIRAYPLLRTRLGLFDVVHAYNMELNPAVGALGVNQDTVTVATLNSYHFLPPSAANKTASGGERMYELIGRPTTGRVLEHFIKYIDRFVAISNSVKEIYTSHGYDRKQIDMIPNMYDPSFSVPEKGSDHGARLLYIGTLKHIKGVEYLVKALTYLPESYYLRIVGDGPQRENLQMLVDAYGLRKRVTFVGHVPYDKIPEQYAESDIFVHPGLWPEPFGRTVLEAMQAGLPVVCTDIGGPSEIVRETDLQCPPKNPGEFATAIAKAHAKGDEVGNRNRQYALRKFAPQNIVSDIIDLYEKLR